MQHTRSEPTSGADDIQLGGDLNPSPMKVSLLRCVVIVFLVSIDRLTRLHNSNKSVIQRNSNVNTFSGHRLGARGRLDGRLPVSGSKSLAKRKRHAAILLWYTPVTA